MNSLMKVQYLNMNVSQPSAANQAPRRPHLSGFTLVEVLIAVSLLAILTIFMLSILGNVFKQNGGSNVNIQVTTQTQNLSEELRKAFIKNYTDYSAAEAEMLAILSAANDKRTFGNSANKTIITCTPLDVLGNPIPDAKCDAEGGRALYQMKRLEVRRNVVVNAAATSTGSDYRIVLDIVNPN